MIYTGSTVNDAIKDLDTYTTEYKADNGNVMFTAKEIAKLIKTLYYNFKVNADGDDDIKSMIDFIVFNYDNEIRRMYEVLTVSYNPIENYNKTATITDTLNSIGANYNVPVDSITEKETAKNSVDSTNSHSEHITGNIGTMSTQNMITQELEIRTLYNIKMFVVARFKEFYIWS